MEIKYIQSIRCFWKKSMNDCPFKKHCKYPKSQKIKIVGLNPEKVIKVCERCPLLYQTKQSPLIEDSKKCLYCNSTLEEIVVSQKVGCSFCYIFIDELQTIVRNSQSGNDLHIGKKSNNLMIHLFEELLEKEKTKNPEHSTNCDKLKSLLKDLF